MSIPTHLPGVTYGPAPRAAGPASTLSLPPRLVVIHDTSNTASAASEAHYAATRTDAQSSWTSAHFYVDQGGPLGSLVLNKQAWAAYSYANGHGWHIEMCGTNAGTAGAVPAVTIAKTAALVRTLCQLGGIPMVKLSPADVAAGKQGICGHWDITQGLHVGTHDDPGPKFDWAGFINQVKQGDEDMTEEQARQLQAVYSAVFEGGTSMGASVPVGERGTQSVAGNAFVDLTQHTRKVIEGVAASVATLTAAVHGLASATGGLSDADRQAIQEATAAVTALNNRLASP